MNTQNPDQLEAAIRSQGEKIFRLMEDDQQSIFNKDWWYGKIMDWSMRDEKFKTQMFRFVDVLPYLESSSEVSRHLKEYFKDTEGQTAGFFNFGLGVGSLAPGLMAAAVRKNVTQMARMFITGENPEDAIPALIKSRKHKIAFTADLLGEATLSEKEALEYQTRYVELIDRLSKESEKWDDIPQIDQDDQGPIPKVNVSVKLTALYSQINDKAWDETVGVLKDRLRPLFSLGQARNVFINVDMEQYKHKDLTLQVFKELLLEPEFKKYPYFGIVLQTYLRDSYKDAQDLIEFARKTRGTPITIRLVKGAYWDYETIHADQSNWPIPVYTNKAESDWNFERCAEVLLKAFPHIRLAAGSHNVRSLASIMVKAESMGLPKSALELQMLYGMAEPIKKALVKEGYRVREYATIGELIPGMAYLVRRLLENTSNESFLRSKFAEKATPEVLLRNPESVMKATADRKERKADRFYNEPLLDFAISENRAKMSGALAAVKSDFGKEYFPIINGKAVRGEKVHPRENPSVQSEIIGKIHLASVAQAEEALNAASSYFSKWSRTSVSERVKLLRDLAALMRRDRFQLMAVEVFETGKTWTEADGDVAEAIDFCEYYATEMERISRPLRVSHVTGEDSFYEYRPRGVALVIAPWNFPLAILCGMAAGALVTGNTVIMKPAEQSSIIAHHLMRLLLEAGAPSEAVQFLPGEGETIGRHLVSSPKVHLISFTGSKAVGLEILKQSGIVHPQQDFVKKCIIEMGGKNALIIDSDADLDEAVAATVYSAFGFSGQKCSAASRVIVLEEIYERYIERLVEATKSIKVLDAANPAAYTGPVVDQEAKERILAIISKNSERFKVLYSGEVPNTGHFVPPTLFADVDPSSELAQEEIFGPVCAIIRAKDLDHAIEIANGVKYALTGGIFSRSPANIEKAKVALECGNLYINRGITGALVGRHPFGGYKLSGLGSKTGGPDYLPQHMEPRVVTENTMRRGFAPMEKEDIPHNLSGE